MTGQPGDTLELNPVVNLPLYLFKTYIFICVTLYHVPSIHDIVFMPSAKSVFEHYSISHKTGPSRLVSMLCATTHAAIATASSRLPDHQ